MSEAELDGPRRQVFESARRLLRGRDEEFPLSHAEIASDTGLEPTVVLQALQSLDRTHLDVRPMQGWARADVHGVSAAEGGNHG